VTGRILEARFRALPPIGLEELAAEAALLTRRDRKYVVPVTIAARLLDAVTPTARILEIDGRRRFHYESVYFDTPDRTSYLTAARKRPRRFKVRTRAYLDTGRCVLEVKTRDPRGRTVKAQHAHLLDARTSLEPADRELVALVPEIGPAGEVLEPALTTRYTRATLLLGADGARATVDTQVTAVAPDGRHAVLEGMVVIETKAAGAPTSVDRLLWAWGHRPVRISKFGTGLAALFPELPSNRWTRALGLPWRIEVPDTTLATEVARSRQPVDARATAT
jgi:hypothetical protein